MSLHPDVNLTDAQAEIFARGLYAVASAEGGVKPEEAGLIKSFFGEVAGGQRVAALAHGPAITPEMVATGLGQSEAARAFLKTCLLLGYADGHYHAQERAVVEAFAQALAVEKAELLALEQSVKEFLLSSVSHLHNTDATAAIAKKLGI